MSWLIRNNSGQRKVAHVWLGNDTACHQWSAGGLNKSKYGVHEHRADIPICAQCQSVTGIKQDRTLNVGGEGDWLMRRFVESRLVAHVWRDGGPVCDLISVWGARKYQRFADRGAVPICKVCAEILGESEIPYDNDAQRRRMAMIAEQLGAANDRG